MNHPLLTGLILVLLAGAMNGSFAVPMKYTREWAWENIWLAWSFVALAFFPLALTLMTAPSAGAIYADSGRTLAVVFLFGAGWGVSQILFGLGISRVGLSVGFAIVVGLAAAVGSLLPLALFHSGQLLSSSGLQLVAGVAMILLGVTLCALAGIKKSEQPSFPLSLKLASVRTGIVLCVLAGAGGSMINLGFIFGGPILDQARRYQVRPPYQANLVWLPLLLSAFLVTCLYCIHQLRANKTWGRFLKRNLQSHWILALLMGALWLGSVEIYGFAAAQLGDWGAVMGWPVFLSTSIITANIWGLLTGEWRHAPLAARRLMFLGVSVLVASIFVVGFVGPVR